MAMLIIDAGCRDFNWMRTVDLPSIEYIGVDVVSDLIERNAFSIARPAAKPPSGVRHWLLVTLRRIRDESTSW